MRILTILLPLLLTACNNDPLALIGEPVKDDVPVFATIADANDPIEMAAAPVVTRLAYYTHNVAQALTHGKISRDQAIARRDAERSLRADIETAVKAKNLNAIRAADATLVGYIKDLETYR